MRTASGAGAKAKAKSNAKDKPNAASRSWLRRTGLSTLQQSSLPARRRSALGLSLFWRTFFLLAILLTGGVFAWLQTLRALELEPRALQSARQTAGLVNLARAALKQADGINRVTLMKGLSAQEATRVTPREPADRWETYETDRYSRQVSQQLRLSLGPDAVVARSVNGTPGTWVGFSIDSDRYWLQAESAHATPLNGSTWMVWTGIALAATLAASVAIASLINRPLRQLSFAASRMLFELLCRLPP